MEYYLIIVHGGVEPELRGPWRTERTRAAWARKLYKKLGYDTALLPLNVEGEGRAQLCIGSYSAKFMDGDKDS